MKRIHLTRLKALQRESARLDAAYDKLHADRLALAIESCPFKPGDDVVVGVMRQHYRVAWVEAPRNPSSKMAWRMTVKPVNTKGKMIDSGSMVVFNDEKVERWVG